MDAHEAMRQICTILGFVSYPSTADLVARVRNLAAQSADAHLRLDNAGVEGGVELPARVDLLRNWVRRAQDGWAQANARLDQSNGELVAARGDLRVEKERADMLEKERDAANQELSETRQALGGFLGPDYRISEEVKKVVSIRDMLAARANEAEQKMMLAVSDLGAMTAERDTLAARVKELEESRCGVAVIPADVDMLDMLCNHAKAYIVFEKRDGSGTKVLLKDNNALGWNGTTNRRIDFDAPATTTAVNAARPGLQPLKCPCGGKIEFGCERVGHCLTCGASCRAMDPPPAIPDPDVREMPFERVTMAPPDTDDQSLTDALVEANLYKKLWRERAQKCQQALRRIRALTGDMSFALDEDWGADDDS